MSLIWLFECDAQECDFHAWLGYWQEWPGIGCALCIECCGEIYLSEPSPEEADYRAEVRVLRIMRRLPPTPGPDLGRTPRERRKNRKAQGLPAKGRQEDPPVPRFEPTGEYLICNLEGKLIPEIPSGRCPECGACDSIVRGLTEGADCPKCAKGRLRIRIDPA